MTVNSSYGEGYGNCYSCCIKLLGNYWLVFFEGTYVSRAVITHDTKIFTNIGIPFTPKQKIYMFIIDDTARDQGVDYVIAITLNTDKSLRFGGTSIQKEHWLGLRGCVCMVQEA